MDFIIKSGNWPTMVTLFNKDNKIDLPAMNRLINWYEERGVDGLFAVCQSSEMFFLSLEEKVALARYIKKQANNVQVIASGHTSDKLEDQLNEIKRISDTGIDAFVLVSNRLAKQNESDDVLKRNIEVILRNIPDVQFGIYECPYPYKRIVTPPLLKWLSETGRFYFLKDTCCDLAQIKLKIDAVKGTPLKIFNANSTTLLSSLKYGVHGYSGVMANFHPELYSWLISNWKDASGVAELLQAFLSMSSLYELKNYPLNAKYLLQLEGISNTLIGRSHSAASLDELQKVEVENLRMMTNFFREQLVV